MSLAIEIKNLHKSFGKGSKQKRVINDASITVNQGEIFGFIGPNGAGKSTIIKLLLQFHTPDSGSMLVFGNRVGSGGEFRHLIGYLSESPFFYEHLTACECLRFAGQLHGCRLADVNRSIPHLLEKMNLAESAHQKIATFSKGMKQRLGFAAAMIHNPPLYIFDEPMSGLDPLGRHLINTIFLELKEAQKTIFFSTHILSDIERLCSRIALIHKGNILYHGDVSGFASVANLDDTFVNLIKAWDNDQHQ